MLDAQKLRPWLGKSQNCTDVIRPQPARFMEMTLDRAPQLQESMPLPPLWHWLYFLQTSPLGELGSDGHTALGDFLPPVGLAKRMWAGGRLYFDGALTIGDTAQKTSTIENIQIKKGRSGMLCFVTVSHIVTANGDTVLREEHDIVYREGQSTATAPLPLTGDWPFIKTVTPSPVMLFRFSALTFNGHRIHYDRDYARADGHRGLVFHGPLTALLMAELAAEIRPNTPLREFSFRAVTPLYDDATFNIMARKVEGGRVELIAVNAAGQTAIQATAVYLSD